MYYTYIIESEQTGKFYIGQTNNLEGRLNKHNLGKVFSTKGRGPWKLIYSKGFNSRSEAMSHEKELKGIKNKEYLKRIIRHEKLPTA
ncbi:MAG: GIY-YIG nuclease family protein [Ignavibacteria bacterium]|nr:GIY-YIG nuclease family protein [Ignavibacteria bacterium]